MTESSSVLHVHPLSVNREVKRLGGFGEPRPKKEKKRKILVVAIPRHKGPRCGGHACHVKLNTGLALGFPNRELHTHAKSQRFTSVSLLVTE